LVEEAKKLLKVVVIKQNNEKAAFERRQKD